MAAAAALVALEEQQLLAAMTREQLHIDLAQGWDCGQISQASTRFPGVFTGNCLVRNVAQTRAA
jgi:hypothetical protein